MKEFLKGLMLILLLGAIAITIPMIPMARAALFDTEHVAIQGRAATLSLSLSNGTEKAAATVPGWGLGENLVPGDTGELILRPKNDGSIPGVVCIKTIKPPPDFLKVSVENACGIVLQPGEAQDFRISWEIPPEAELGMGGQEIEFQLLVELRQE